MIQPQPFGIRHWLAVLALLMLTGLPITPSVQLTNCGRCVCDSPGITCDFEKVKDSITSGTNLADFTPTVSVMRRLELDPLAYRDLYINCKNSPAIKNQRLSRSLLRGYTNLSKLSVVKCDLVSIEPDALVDLTNLRELDVSNNQLQRLPSELFRSRSMVKLTLSENPRLALNNDTFRDFSVDRLVLSNCGLDEFPWDSLREIRCLQDLTLSQNNIRLVPTEAMQLVTQLRVLYLDGNPLSCTCSKKWLREKIDWNRVSPPIINSAKLPKCGSPPTLRDIELTQLSPSDFPCLAPEIRSVDIRLEPDAAQLICSADWERPGPMTWIYRHLPIYPDIPNGYPSRTYESSGGVFRQSVRRTPGYEREKYTLTARAADGQTTNFSLTLHWPLTENGADSASTPNKNKDSQDSSSSAGAGGSNKLPAESQKPTTDGSSGTGSGDYFSRKQFTLIEMIIAVVGTFMATSLIFLLACQAIQWYNKRDKKRWAAGYGGPPYSYSYNSHRPPSHEYDVPRIDQPCLLPKPPPPPLQPPPPPPQHTLPMPPGPVSLSSASSGSGTSAAVQTLLSKQHQQHHLPMATSASSNGIGMGDMEFLDYGGHRMFNQA